MLKFEIKGLDRIKFDEDGWWERSQPKVAKMLEQEHRDVWAKEQSPWDGSKWKELKPEYKEKKELKWGPQPILRASGRMQDNMKIRANNDGTFQVQTTKYGAYHQFGTPKMPQRVWVGIPEFAVPKMADIVCYNLFQRKGK
jgi:phage gpG-like protein